jgi:hypothetical protein
VVAFEAIGAVAHSLLDAERAAPTGGRARRARSRQGRGRPGQPTWPVMAASASMTTKKVPIASPRALTARAMPRTLCSSAWLSRCHLVQTRALRYDGSWNFCQHPVRVPGQGPAVVSHQKCSHHRKGAAGQGQDGELG